MVKLAQVSIISDGKAGRGDDRFGKAIRVSDQRIVVVGDLHEHHGLIAKCEDFFARRPHAREGVVQPVTFIAEIGFVALGTHAALPMNVLIVIGARNHFKAAQDNTAPAVEVQIAASLNFSTVKQVLNVTLVYAAILKHGLIADAGGIISNMHRQLVDLHLHNGAVGQLHPRQADTQKNGEAEREFRGGKRGSVTQQPARGLFGEGVHEQYSTETCVVCCAYG